MIVSNYNQALRYLHNSIPKGQLRYPGKIGLERQSFLLNCLNNPQNLYPIIHLAGTSGKGSTASFLSHLLNNHGFQVGLTISPHIFDIRERIQINNKLISQKDFVFLLNQIIPAIQKTQKSGLGNPTYFEIMVTLFYFAFYYFKVDYAIVETGMGGLMDGTNVVTSKNKIAVITRLGIDHTKILGKTISQIAFQKAGIIHPQNTVLSSWQTPKARLVLNQTAKDNQTDIIYIKKGINYKNIQLKENNLNYDFNFNDFYLKQLSLNTIAFYQIENSALALSVFKIISQRDFFNINQNIVRKTLSNFKFFGRMDIFKIKNSKNQISTVIFDGAHNPQKMTSLVKSLKLFYPNQRFIFIVAFKQKKEAKKMLREIISIASKIILTSFQVEDQDMLAISQNINSLNKILDSLKFDNYQEINNPNLAIQTAINESNLVGVTGSLYLLTKIYSNLKIS